MALSKEKESVVKKVDDAKLLAADDEQNDLPDIIDAVSKLAAHYRQFGIGLGIPPSKIEEIQRQRQTPSTVKDKFSQVVTVRFGQLPAPTWKTFIDAARPINRALADKVEKVVQTNETLELNVRAVTERFNGIAAKYYQFGSNLKILPGELDGIRNEVSIHDLLHDVVHEFLTSSREKFKPTWRTIVGAVFDINRALAEEIAKEHTGQSLREVNSLNVPQSNEATDSATDMAIMQQIQNPDTNQSDDDKMN